MMTTGRGGKTQVRSGERTTERLREKQVAERDGKMEMKVQLKKMKTRDSRDGGWRMEEEEEEDG
jgi:hypothetical protein